MFVLGGDRKKKDVRPNKKVPFPVVGGFGGLKMFPESNICTAEHPFFGAIRAFLRQESGMAIVIGSPLEMLFVFNREWMAIGANSWKCST
jgi:hypothetical protein